MFVSQAHSKKHSRNEESTQEYTTLLMEAKDETLWENQVKVEAFAKRAAKLLTTFLERVDYVSKRLDTASKSDSLSQKFDLPLIETRLQRLAYKMDYLKSHVFPLLIEKKDSLSKTIYLNDLSQEALNAIIQKFDIINTCFQQLKTQNLEEEIFQEIRKKASSHTVEQLIEEGENGKKEEGISKELDAVIDIGLKLINENKELLTAIYNAPKANRM